MRKTMSKYEPTSFEVVKSYKNVRNTTLARKVHALNTWTSYDRCQAHTWALRLIHENPQNGRDVAGALINFDYMIPAAQAHYDSRERDRKRCDAIFEVFKSWKEEAQIEAAA
ncbi:hypothetical protein EVC05_051 [Rhizobium phage RHph_N2]|nr:hypothetical protein EVC05_051 [Rhizobium phage RHph_N2]